jgi:hypothetical protein
MLQNLISIILALILAFSFHILISKRNCIIIN